MRKAVIGLGANLGDRKTAIREAVHALSLLPGTSVLQCSGIYETVPVGIREQPDFLNSAVLIETKLTPHALLGACLGIEAAAGRIRTVKNGPRIIDLDLLLYEGINCGGEELLLPHPRMSERAFVLAPLSDLFPCGDALGFLFDAKKDYSAMAVLFCSAEEIITTE